MKIKEKREKKNKKRKPTTAESSVIKPHTPLRKVDHVITNQKTPRKLVFHICEPPLVLPGDDWVAHSLTHSMTTPITFFYFFFVIN
jgi:glycerol-3-phosphate cytidylyltransferase-like family protein